MKLNELILQLQQLQNEAKELDPEVLITDECNSMGYIGDYKVSLYVYEHNEICADVGVGGNLEE